MSRREVVGEASCAREDEARVGVRLTPALPLDRHQQGGEEVHGGLKLSGKRVRSESVIKSNTCG